MIDNDPTLVGGEPCLVLADSLASLKLGKERNGMVPLKGTVNQHVVRAFMRFEAKLLLEDADSLAAGDAVDRTPAQRRADAFVALMKAVAEKCAELRAAS
jgi:hypothetical protein